MPADLEKFKKELLVDKGGKVGEYHDEVLTRVKRLIEISRSAMSKNYSTWDHHDHVFRSRRHVDKEDMSARGKGMPAKLIVPLTYSQIMTYVSYCVITVTQNKRFFELEDEGLQQKELKEVMEKLLERDCRRNTWNSFLVQFFLDQARFWMGCAEVAWVEDYRHIRMVQQTPTMGAFGVPGQQTTNDYVKVPHFVGNKVYPISPYRFFPDTRLPLTRFQEGEFCGSEDMFSMSALRSGDDNLFNLDFIPKMNEVDYKNRRQRSRIDEMEVLPAPRDGQPSSDLDNKSQVQSGAVAVTKIVLDIIPNNFECNGEKPLGDEKFPVRFLCWYANDKRVIRFEEAQYLHGQFPYICAQYLPDQHQTVNEGLSSVCDQITNLITWKLNAHLTSQKSTLDSKFAVDPSGVDVKSLESRSPYIMLKRSAANMGVDRYIKQFTTQDPTQNVMPDIAGLKDLLEGITGISSMMQGQSSRGRRSATQDQVVAQGASARAKTTLSSGWDDAFEPLGRQLITNNRQEMDMDTFQRILGPGPFGTDGVTIEQLYAVFKADPFSLASAEDFFVFDATMPSEKAFLAQSLQEIFMAIFQNPQISQILGYGPEQIRYLFNEIYELRGVTPPSMPTPQPMQALPPAAGQPPQPGAPPPLGAGAPPSS